MFDQHTKETVKPFHESVPARMDENQNMSEIKDAVSNINNELVEIKDCLKKHVFENLATCFKCLICLEPNGSAFYNCPFCGSFLGCFSCINKLNKCPICQKEFKCGGCKLKLHRQPYKIPGLEKFIPRKDPPTSRNEITEDSSSDDDLPIVL